MPQYVPLPDGSSVTVQPGETPKEAWARAQRQYPEAFAGPEKPKEEGESGFLPALKASYGSIKGDIAALAGRTGLTDIAAAEKYQKEQEEEGKRIYKPTEKGWLEAPGTKFGELLGGSIPYMAAPAAAGLAALALPETLAAAPILGGLTTAGEALATGLTGATSAAQFTGSNLSRQMQEGKSLKETNLGAAAAAAVPQAALDVFSMHMIPGIKNIFGSAGEKLTDEAAKKIAQQGLAKTLGDYAFNAGKTASIEGLTEAGQQVFERLQAGLSLNDPEARQEYLDNFLGGAVLGGTLAPMGRYGERAKAKQQNALAEQAQLQAQTKTQPGGQPEQDPAQLHQDKLANDKEYMAQFIQDYEDQKDAFKELQKQTKKPNIKTALPDEIAQYEQNKTQLGEMRNMLKEHAEDYLKYRPIFNQMQKEQADQQQKAEQQRLQGIEQEAAGIPQQAQQQPYYQAPQGQLEGMAPPGIDPQAQQQLQQQQAEQLYTQQKRLAQQLEAHQAEESEAAGAGRIDVLKDLRQKGKELQAQHDKINTQLKTLGGYKPTENPVVAVEDLQNKLAKKQKDLQKLSGPGYDPQKADKLIKDIEDLQAQVQTAKKNAPPEQMGFDFGNEFKPTYSESKEQTKVVGLSKELQQTVDEKQRLIQAYHDEQERQQKVSPEIEALKRIKEAPVGKIEYQPQVSSLVDELVDNLYQEGPHKGRVITGTSPEKIDKPSAIRAQLAYANVTDNKERTIELKKKLEDLNEPEEAIDTYGDFALGQTAEKAGVVGQQSVEGYNANKVTRIAQQQLAAYDRFSSFLNNVREGNQDVSPQRKDILRSAAERLKETTIGMALQEADAKRAQLRKPPMTIAEQTKLVREMNGVLNELINRGVGLFEPKETHFDPYAPAGEQYTKKRPPIGNRVFNNYKAASSSIRAQMRSVIDANTGTTEGVVSQRKPITKGPFNLKPQFAGQETAVNTQFAEALKRAKTDAEHAQIEELQKSFKNLSDNSKEEVLKEIRNVINGKTMSLSSALKDDLADLKQARLDEGKQAELFPGESEKGVTRTTSNRFLKYLDSNEVNKMRASIVAANKQAKKEASKAVQAQKEAESIDERVDDLLLTSAAYLTATPEEIVGLNKTVTREEKEAQLKNVKARNDKAVENAAELQKEIDSVIVRLNKIVQDAEEANAHNQIHLKDLQEIYDYVAKRFLERPGVKKFGASLEFYTEELTKAQESADASKRAYSAAKRIRDRVTQDSKNDSVNKQILEKGRQARVRIKNAEAALAKAKEEEAQVNRHIERLKGTAPKAKKEQEITKTSAGEKVFRDTMDPQVQAAVRTNRRDMGKAQNELEIAIATGNEEAIAKAYKVIKQTDDAFYEIINNAPMRRVQPGEEGNIRTFDNAQTKTQEKMLALADELVGATLSNRRLESVTKNRQGQISQKVLQKTVAQEEKEARAQAEGPKTPLEKMAEVQPKLTEIRNRISYLDEHPAATNTKGAKVLNKKQKEIKADLKAQEKELAKQMTALKQEQSEFIKEKLGTRTQQKSFSKITKDTLKLANKETKVSAAIENVYHGQNEDVHTLDQVMAQKALFRTVSGSGTSLSVSDVAKWADKIVGRWANVPDIMTVDSEDQLPIALKQQIENAGKVGKVPGLYDPTTKRVYLIAKNLFDPQDIALTIAHEITGHYGIREMLGKDYAKTMQNLYENNTYIKEQADIKLAEDPKLGHGIAVEEVLAEMAEKGVDDTPEQKSALREIFDAIKNWFAKTFGYKTIPDSEVRQIVANARRYVIEGGTKTSEAEVSKAVFRTAKAVEFENELSVADKIIASPKNIRQKVEANLGLAGRTQFLDRLAPIEATKEQMGELAGTQMMYYLRMADQKMSFVQQAVGNGVPQFVEYTRKDGKKETIIESVKGANLHNAVNYLKQTPGMNAEAANRLFTLYLAGKRAERVGHGALNFDVSDEEIKKAVAKIEANESVSSVFNKARNEYNKYNRDLINFLQKAGVISKEEASRLVKNDDYIPYYRERNGNAQLIIGNENPITIGNLKDQPQLKQLIGGNEKITDFLTSAISNTSMIMDAGLRNQAAKNAMFELVNVKLAQFLKGNATGPDIVRFKDNGVEKTVRVDTDKVGISSDLLVKGMEGIPVNTSQLIQLMGSGASLVRKAVTLNPVFAMRQIFRDSVAAPLLSGADFMPILGAVKELGKSATKSKLEARGITGGQIFTGTNEDLKKVLKDFQSGKIGLSQLIAKAEALNMEADASTRRAQYNSYINQGLSEMEATLMSLESMNFNRKGLSTSVRIASQIIPFFNAQLQSLDVLWRALSGKLPFNERLKIQEKLFKRGMLVAGTSVAYALLMQDDEAYKNATPDQKYGNFFVYLPGIKEPLRVPVPFEIGYIFKGIPEAFVNTLMNKNGAEEAAKAFKAVALQTIPGGSSGFMPGLVKPLVENTTGYSFYTGRSIETKSEQQLLPEFRYRDDTSVIAKGLGSALGYSPIKIDNLIRGYTGTLGTAMAQAVSLAMPDKGPEKTAKRLTEMPVVGALFQPLDAGGQVEAVYDRLLEIQETKKTFDNLINKGQRQEAMTFLQQRSNELALGAMAGTAQAQLNNIAKAMNAIKASDMTAAEKREELSKLQQVRINYAKAIRDVTDKN